MGFSWKSPGLTPTLYTKRSVRKKKLGVFGITAILEKTYLNPGRLTVGTYKSPI